MKLCFLTLSLLSLSYSQPPLGQFPNHTAHNQHLYHMKEPETFQFRGTSAEGISIRGRSAIKNKFFSSSQYVSLGGIDYTIQDLAELEAYDDQREQWYSYTAYDNKFYFKTVEGEISLFSPIPKFNTKPEFIKHEDRITSYSLSKVKKIVEGDPYATNAVNDVNKKQTIFYIGSSVTIATLLTGALLSANEISNNREDNPGISGINPLVYIGAALSLLTYFFQPEGKEYQKPANIYNTNNGSNSYTPINSNESEDDSESILYEEAIEE